MRQIANLFFLTQQTNSCSRSPLSFSSRENLFSLSAGGQKIPDDSPPSLSCPYSCGNLNGLPCYKARLSTIGCCPYPHENYTIDYVEYAPGCNDPGFECRRVNWQFAFCDTSTGSGCYEAVLVPCVSQQCVDADLDGYPVQSPTCSTGPFDCDDTNEFVNPGITQENCNTPGDDNCNNKINCEDEECRIALGEQCDEQCDQDNDGYYKVSCDGNDCHDNWSLANPGIPYETAGSGPPEMYCEDDWDNDCDGSKNCDDSDCEGSCGPPPPPLTPTPTPTPSACPPQLAEDCINSLGMWIEEDCYCDHSIGPHTPIIVDLEGDGFDLTDAASGVDFDFYGDGDSERLGWTDIGSDEAFLVLDRNGNQTIDDASELFGNFTPQPSPPVGESRNGFLALAVFDRLANGGNLDGQIDRRDNVFNRLRLWRDINHNGFSEANELRRLINTPIRAFELTYFTSRRTDQHGNQFRYRAIVRDERGAQAGRWAWDVFLVSQ